MLGPLPGRAGLSAAAYSAAADAAIPQTMQLCEEVMANCFVNASYNPARNGTCPGDIFLRVRSRGLP